MKVRKYSIYMTFCLYDKKKRTGKSSLKVIFRTHLREYEMNESKNHIIVWSLPELILCVFYDTDHLFLERME